MCGSPSASEKEYGGGRKVVDFGICNGVVAASRHGRLLRCFGGGFDGRRGNENRAAEQREEYG